MYLALQISASIISTVLLVGLGIRLVHFFQLGGYRNKPFLHWLVSKNNFYAVTLFSVSLLGLGAAWIMHFFTSSPWAYFGLLFYFILAIAVIIINQRKNSKTPMRFTPRVYRLLVVILILSAGLSFIKLYFSNTWFLPLLATILPAKLIIAAILMLPIEWTIKQTFIRRAKRKLGSPEYADTIRIGIAGSHGKTSCKNILAAMLGKKYVVLASPGSYNTPMGFTRTVLQKLEPGTEVFIMEMGERFPGDIREMCDLFKPQHGIVTGIGAAHLGCFKTQDAIEKELGELVNAIPDGGVVIKGVPDKFEKFQTKLLGKHNQQNINICAQMARALGISDDDIRDAVKNLEPTPHRLQLIETPNGVKILDDSYNASPASVIAALDVLKQLKSENSESSIVVMTPGMIELGKQQYNENHKFGEQIAKIANHAIIVGDTNKDALNKGLVSAGMDKTKIHIKRTVEDAKTLFPTLVKSGDILLISNDLPDNFC